MQPPSLPIAQCYWVIPGRFLAGEYPGAKADDEPIGRAKIRALLTAGIDYFADLTTEHDPLRRYDDWLREEATRLGRRAEHHRFPIPDVSVPTMAFMVQIIDALDAALAAGRNVYVHCWGGVGRTGTVVGCFLVRHGKTPDEALAWVQAAYAATPKGMSRGDRSPEAASQFEMVRRFPRAGLKPDRNGRNSGMGGGPGAKPVGIEYAPVALAPHDPSRYRGALLGLAAGDALGTTLEFKGHGPHHLTDMVGGGPFSLLPGQWTDDTSMALCLAASLVICRGFDPADQMRRYVRWRDEGYMSSKERCFDIGNATTAALSRFLQTGQPYAGSEDPQTAGNGSLMRLAPVPMFYALTPREALERAAASSRTTHAARTAVDACRYYAGLIVGALEGRRKEELLAPRFSPVPGYWDAYPLCPEVDAVAAGSFLVKEPPQVRGTGYVVATLEAALWAFARTDDFRAGALLVVNLGDDADTTGAVYGQLAGAYYGEGGIPKEWRAKLAHGRLIAFLAEALYESRPPAE